MGLFGDDSVTSVATTVQRMIPDNALPDAVKSGTVHALFTNGSVTDQILENLAASVGVKAERLYEYAKTSYPYGLPSGQFLVNNQGVEQVTAVLTALEGAPVTISYSRLAVPNILHVGWIKLFAQYGYNPATNQIASLTAQKGTPVYLTDLVVHLPASQVATLQAEATELWGLSPKTGGIQQELAAIPDFEEVVGFTPTVVDSAASAPYVELQYWWMANVGGGMEARQTGTATLTMAGYDGNANYLQVRYTVGDAVRYWAYRLGDGTYPALDALVDTPPQAFGTFFPFMYFRLNKASTTADTTTAAYRATKKMFKYLDIDYAASADSINTNPSIADVEQAMLVFAVPAGSTDPLELRYLHGFFARLYEGTAAQYSTSTEESLQRGLLGRNILSPAPRSVLVIRDQQFKLAIAHQGLYRRTRVGTIGAVGACTVTVGTMTRKAKYRTKESGALQDYTVTLPLHTYRRQLSSIVYDEIQVVDLQTQYHIWNEYTVTARGDDANLLIPLDRAITEDYPTQERERLYARSLHYVFNSRQTVELAWYQTDLFQFLLIAATVVITIITYGATWKEMVATIAAAGITVSVAMAVITGILKFIVVSAAVKLFVKQVGGEAAMVLAAIALAYGVKAGIELGAAAPLSTTLLQASNTLLKGAGEYYGDALKGLQQEFLLESQQEQEKNRLLARANDLLKTDSILSPVIFFGETPDQYYTRTVHSGNIGIIGIDAVSNYVERSLSLPTLPERFGGLADV